MAGIDQNAMYRAGFSSKSTGRNLGVEEGNRRNQMVADAAFNVLGSITQNASQQALAHLHNYRNQTDSSMASVTTKINKINPKNIAIKAKIKEWKEDYRKAVRESYNIFNKEKRGAAKDRAAVIMSKLFNANEQLEGYMTGAKTSQLKQDAILGINQIEGKNYKMHGGTSDIERRNVGAQADGTMGVMLDFDDDGFLVVQGGGDPVRYDKMKFGEFEDPAIEDTYRKTADLLKELAFSDNAAGHAKFKSGDYKEEFYSFINNATNRQFKDFFFGGFSHEFTSNRKATTAPAYLYLRKRAMNEDLPEDNKKVNYRIENGKNVFDSWKDGFGPGSTDWSGEMAALQLMDFDASNTAQSDIDYSSGSRFRESVAESQWATLEKDYEADRLVKQKKDEDAINAGNNNLNAKDIQIRTGVRFNKITVDNKVNSLQEIVKNKEGTWIDFDGISWEYNNGKLRTPESQNNDGSYNYRTYDPQGLLERSMPTASHLYKVDWPEAPSMEAWNNAQNVPMVNFKDEKKGPQITGKGTSEKPFSNPPKDRNEYKTGKYYINVDGFPADEVKKWNGKNWIN